MGGWDADHRAVRAAALAGFALGCAAIARGAAPVEPAPPFTISPLPGVAWAVLLPEGRNGGFVAGSSGVLLVDPPTAAAAARLLLFRVRALNRHSPRWLVHTRAQPPGSPGDRVFTRAGAALVRSGRTVDLGDSRVEISSMAVHPGGDSVVFFSREDVVFAGDLFQKETIPDVIAADTDAWTQTLDGFLARHPAGHFVGSAGQPGRALDVRFLRDYLSGLRVSIRDALARGESGAEMADRLLALQRARFGHWTGFDARARRNIGEVERDLNGAEKIRH